MTLLEITTKIYTDYFGEGFLLHAYLYLMYTVPAPLLLFYLLMCCPGIIFFTLKKKSETFMLDDTLK